VKQSAEENDDCQSATTNLMRKVMAGDGVELEEYCIYDLVKRYIDVN
jgi:hypothetical protein